MIFSENDSLAVLARIKVRETADIVGKRHDVYQKKLDLIDRWMRGDIADAIYHQQIAELDGMFYALSWAISLESPLNYDALTTFDPDDDWSPAEVLPENEEEEVPGELSEVEYMLPKAQGVITMKRQFYKEE